MRRNASLPPARFHQQNAILAAILGFFRGPGRPARGGRPPASHLVARLRHTEALEHGERLFHPLGRAPGDAGRATCLVASTTSTPPASATGIERPKPSQARPVFSQKRFGDGGWNSTPAWRSMTKPWARSWLRAGRRCRAGRSRRAWHRSATRARPGWARRRAPRRRGRGRGRPRRAARRASSQISIPCISTSLSIAPLSIGQSASSQSTETFGWPARPGHHPLRRGHQPDHPARRGRDRGAAAAWRSRSRPPSAPWPRARRPASVAHRPLRRAAQRGAVVESLQILHVETHGP